MLSDDTFKAKLATTIAQIDDWLERIRPVATVEVGRDQHSWRVSVRPHVPEACPFELLLRTDQRFDLSVGPETYEDQPMRSPDEIPEMLKAIAEARVSTRYRHTAATNSLVEVATIISASGNAGEPLWRQHRQVAGEEHVVRDAAVLRDVHYAPYARGA